jgi:16S rRNA (uracil1498-N3)-methyltransferase
MPKFFVKAKGTAGETLFITGGDASHISRSLRLSAGDDVTLCDGMGLDMHCKIKSVYPDAVEAEIIYTEESAAEPRVKITLFPAVSKNDKMDFMIQKAVELGVYRIVPVISKRCVVAPDEKSAKNRAARWNRIAEEASKQCGRGIIPEVSDIIHFKEAVQYAKEMDMPLIAYENERESLKSILSSKPFVSAAVISGPEGGFEASEIEYSKENGVVPISLGHRILRAETAPLAAVACILYHTDTI